MSADMSRISRPMTVCHWDFDETMRFFHVPAGAAFTIVAESSSSGCVEILYENRLYVAFKRDLMSHSQNQSSEKEPVMSTFYVVQRSGVPAVWQAAPDQMRRLLKRKSKTGYSVASDMPSNTRAEALNKLRELFPDCRQLKSAE
jgi:hypothetical protein